MLKNLSNFVKENKLFVLVVILGTALRFVAITEVPPSLNWDEVSHGYNAYSLLKTGKDEWGEFFPTIFKAYGDYKLPVYIYLTAISEFFFGLNTFAVRLPSVLAGVGTVIFTYLLVKELMGFGFRFASSDKLTRNLPTQNRTTDLTALLSALLVTVEPWSLFLSRAAFEANLALFLFTSGTFFFFKGLKKPKFLILNSLLFGLTVWTYNSYRIFTPLILVVLVFLYRKTIREIYKKTPSTIHYSLVTTVVLFLPMFYQLFNPIGQARYGRVEILDEGAIAQINEARGGSKYSPSISRIIYNKGTFFTQRFIKNYFAHYSPKFLFFEGGSNYQFSLPGKGLIYPINIVFLPIGLFYILKKHKKLSLIIYWLILAPLASSLTREAPQVLRTITMLPTPMIISALGLVTSVEWSEKFISKRILNSYYFKGLPRVKALYIAYFLILAVLVENYLNNYFTKYKIDYSWSWQYGYEQVIDYARNHYQEYDKIILTKKYGESHEFVLFYWPWDPAVYRADPGLIRFYQSNWYWVDRFDKFYFVNDWDIPKEEKQDFKLESGGSVQCSVGGVRCLLITSPGNAPKKWEKLEMINFLDNRPAFEMYEN